MWRHVVGFRFIYFKLHLWKLTSSRVSGIELGQFLFSLILDLLTHLSQFFGKLRAMAWDILQQDFKNETCNRVEIACESFAPQPQCFRLNRSATGRRVNNQRRLFGMGCTDQGTCRGEESVICGIVPVGKISDEGQNRLAQTFIGFHQQFHFRGIQTGHIEQRILCFRAEFLGAKRGSQGSGRRSAISIARQAARGLLAHHRRIIPNSLPISLGITQLPFFCLAPLRILTTPQTLNLILSP